MEQAWRNATKAIARLESEKLRLERDAAMREQDTERERGSLQSLSAANARLAAKNALLERELAQQQTHRSEQDAALKQLASELRDAQQQLLALKLDEASAVASERRKGMAALDDAHEQFQWRENELLGKLRDAQSRLAEREAAAEKFQSQLEDETLHVASLRHEVANLSALLSQAQATLTAKHSTSASSSSGRDHHSRSARSDTVSDSGADRAFMLRMLELLSRVQPGAVATSVDASVPPPPPPLAAQRPAPLAVQPATITHSPIAPSTEDTAAIEREDTARRQREAERIESERRAFEQERIERMEREDRELVARKRAFDDELARKRQARLDEDQRVAREQQEQRAAAEAQMQRSLEMQRKAMEDMAETERQRLLAQQQQLEAEQRMQHERLQQETLRLEHELAERTRLQQKQREEAAAEQRRRDDEAALKAFAVAQEAEARRKQQELDDAAAAATIAAQLERTEHEHRSAQALTDAAADAAPGSDIVAVEDDDTLADSDELAVSADTSNTVDDAGDRDEALTAAPSAALSYDQTLDPRTSECSDRDHSDELAQSTSVASDEESRASETDRAVVPLSEDAVASSAAAEAPLDDSNIAESCEEAPQERKTPVDAIPAVHEPSEDERRRAAEEEKKRQDDATMDVYRQRVLARKAAEKQRQLDEAEAERKRQEEEAATAEAAQTRALDASGSDHDEELELSGGSFAESRFVVLLLLWMHLACCVRVVMTVATGIVT